MVIRFGNCSQRVRLRFASPGGRPEDLAPGLISCHWSRNRPTLPENSPVVPATTVRARQSARCLRLSKKVSVSSSCSVETTPPAGRPAAAPRSW